MNQEIKEKWINALTSGKYKQGKGCLRDENNNYCCLGVLVDIAAEEGVVEWDKKLVPELRRMVHSVDGIHGVLPPAVKKWAGLYYLNPMDDNGLTLSSINDSGKDFTHIAEVIGKDL